MIVQPEPTTGRGRRRRARQLVAIVAPAAILLAVVAAGVLGRPPDPPPGDASPAPPSLAAATPGADDGSPRLAPSWVPDEAPAFPAELAGLPVRTVPDARERLYAAGSRPVAVAGWLGDLRPPASCPLATGDVRGALSPLCERRALLVVAQPAAGSPSAHLHVTVPPGVQLPAPFEDADTAATAAVPVVLLGRASPSGAGCLQSARGCREQLQADAVLWADGAAWDATLLQDAGLLDTPASIAYRRLPAARALATRGDAVVLLEAVLRPSTIGAVDAEAAAVLARLPEPEALVWYVRSLRATPGTGDAADGPAGRIRWLLLDERTGRRLASGVSGDAARTALAPAIPGDVAGMNVRGVAEAVDDADAGAPRPLDAVEGYLLAWTEPGGCLRPVPGLPAVGCPRHAVLATEPWTTTTRDGGEPPGTHLHAIVPPGVAVPDSAIQVDGSDGVPAEVVLVLRAATPADCRVAPDCPPFVVERVAWAEGQWLVGGRLAAAPLAVSPDDPVGRDPAAAIDADLLLRAVLVDAAQLRILDPRAARVVAGEDEPPGPLWYLRGLDVPDGTRPVVRWEVRRAPSGELIAAGEVR